MFGNIFGCHNWAGGDTASYLTEVRIAAKHPKTHRSAPNNKELSRPKCQWCQESRGLENQTKDGWSLTKHSLKLQFLYVCTEGRKYYTSLLSPLCTLAGVWILSACPGSRQWHSSDVINCNCQHWYFRCEWQQPSVYTCQLYCRNSGEQILPAKHLSLCIQLSSSAVVYSLWFIATVT